MTNKFFPTIFLLIIGIAANAQTLKQWTWDYYKIKFKAPSNLAVQKNDETVYEAGNSAMFLDIYPHKGENLTYDGMKNAVINWATDLKLSYSSVNSAGNAQPIYLESINGFWGCAIDGTSSSGLPATIMLIVNPDDPDLSFYIWLNYSKEYYHDAIAVLKSFTPM